MICAKCNRPIKASESYYFVRTPEGEKPVHAKCMEVPR